MSLFSMTFLRARPYGSLGPLEWQQRDGLVFGGLHGRNDLQPIADRILTYTEQREHGDVRVQISEALTEAELIIFIGFGFHQQNMMLLKPHNRETKRQVFATAVGIHKDNHELYQRGRIAATTWRSHRATAKKIACDKSSSRTQKLNTARNPAVTRNAGRVARCATADQNGG